MAYGGAIIHVIYEILKRQNRVNKPFAPSMIVNEYKKIKEEPFTLELITKFKKYNKDKKVLKTLENIGSLRAWLYKHSGEQDKRKGRSYFTRKKEGKNTKFELKPKFVEILEKELRCMTQ